jgi:hypothetical protein
MLGALRPLLHFFQGVGMVIKGNSQAIGQGKSELMLYGMVGLKQGLESFSVKINQSKPGQGSGVYAVRVVGQQGCLAEVASWTNMADDKLAVVRDIHGQLHFPLGNDIKTAVILALPIDVVTLFNDLPMPGIDELSHHFGVKVFKKFRRKEALSQPVLFEYSHGFSDTLFYSFFRFL